MWDAKLIQGDALTKLRKFRDQSIHCCVTSPPYFGLRDYETGTWEGGDERCEHIKRQENQKAVSGSSTLGYPCDGGPRRITDNNNYFVDSKRQQYRSICLKCGAKRIDQQIGLEETPAEYVAKLVEVFREVRRVLRNDGTLWLNLGDSYNGSGAKNIQVNSPKQMTNRGGTKQRGTQVAHLKPKDLIGIPWRTAFALQEDGWYLRSDIIWAKPNPMPESVTDRPTKSHEYLFLMSKSPNYYYDGEQIKERSIDPESIRGRKKRHSDHFVTHDGDGKARTGAGLQKLDGQQYLYRNKRSVWTIVSESYSGAHFATFPTKLVEPCILAGCPPGGIVLDPFAGSGTTLAVAIKHGCRGIGIELNPEYIKLAEQRIQAARNDVGFGFGSFRKSNHEGH